MNILFWNDLNPLMKKKVLTRSDYNAQMIRQDTLNIIENVQQYQDEALQRYTLAFDKVALTNFQVSHNELLEAEKNLSNEEQEAIYCAIKRVKVHACAQLPQNWRFDSQDGIRCERQARPIESVGLYVPGGTAPLVSTVVMLAVPAWVAGCKERVLCTPPAKDGSVAPAILVAAKKSGIDRIFKVGGAQAIAAMAYGTQTIPKVDKIFGPGNAWVTQAKTLCALDQSVSIDMPAGPSELLVIADETADPELIAADLLSQAEHDVNSQVILITTSLLVAQQVLDEIKRQKRNLQRLAIIEQSLQNSKIIVVETLEMAFLISNEYGPEHLSLQIKEPNNALSQVQHAGTVFVGHWAAEALGDYLTGANHVLPTHGATRTLSGLSVLDFMKWVGFQYVNQQGLAHIGATAAMLAKMEQLKAHEQAIRLRLEKDQRK